VVPTGFTGGWEENAAGEESGGLVLAYASSPCSAETGGEEGSKKGGVMISGAKRTKTIKKEGKNGKQEVAMSQCEFPDLMVEANSR